MSDDQNAGTKRFLEHQAETILQPLLERAGERLLGGGDHPGSTIIQPTWGWTSPTYGDKIPALAVIVPCQGSLPLYITSEWILPYETS